MNVTRGLTVSECIVSEPQWGAQNPIREDDLAARIDALPASAGLWRFIALLSLGGFFELYDLFQTQLRFYFTFGLAGLGAAHLVGTWLLVPHFATNEPEGDADQRCDPTSK